MSKGGSSDQSSFVDESWASWFCNLSGNNFFCEIDRSFMEDSFNLFGIKQCLPKDYNKALDTILDRYDPNEAESEDISRSAILLYGLIHARYIITSLGLEAMHRKYLQREFGECMRTYCRGQSVLPMGLSDEHKHSTVKVYCPKCQDVYNCPLNFRHIDGAFFGPTFPHLFLMTYEVLVPEVSREVYVPRVFGFKIHKGNYRTNSHSSVSSTGRNNNNSMNTLQRGSATAMYRAALSRQQRIHDEIYGNSRQALPVVNNVGQHSGQYMSKTSNSSGTSAGSGDKDAEGAGGDNGNNGAKREGEELEGDGHAYFVNDREGEMLYDEMDGRGNVQDIRERAAVYEFMKAQEMQGRYSIGDRLDRMERLRWKMPFDEDGMFIEGDYDGEGNFRRYDEEYYEEMAIVEAMHQGGHPYATSFPKAGNNSEIADNRILRIGTGSREGGFVQQRQQQRDRQQQQQALTHSSDQVSDAPEMGQRNANANADERDRRMSSSKDKRLHTGAMSYGHPQQMVQSSRGGYMMYAPEMYQNYANMSALPMPSLAASLPPHTNVESRQRAIDEEAAYPNPNANPNARHRHEKQQMRASRDMKDRLQQGRQGQKRGEVRVNRSQDFSKGFDRKAPINRRSQPSELMNADVVYHSVRPNLTTYDGPKSSAQQGNHSSAQDSTTDRDRNDTDRADDPQTFQTSNSANSNDSLAYNSSHVTSSENVSGLMGPNTIHTMRQPLSSSMPSSHWKEKPRASVHQRMEINSSVGQDGGAGAGAGAGAGGGGGGVSSNHAHDIGDSTRRDDGRSVKRERPGSAGGTHNHDASNGNHCENGDGKFADAIPTESSAIGDDALHPRKSLRYDKEHDRDGRVDGSGPNEKDAQDGSACKKDSQNHNEMQHGHASNTNLIPESRDRDASVALKNDGRKGK